MQEVITSSKNEKLRNIALLQKKKKLREEEGLFVIEGLRIFEDALRSAPDRIDQVYISESFAGGNEWKRICSDKAAANAERRPMSGVTDRMGSMMSSVRIVAEDVFEKICETVTPQGILCVMKMKKYGYSDLPKEKLLLLENIQDPGNLGTMVRTAEAAGMTGIIMSADTVDIYSPKVTRSTKGSIFRVPFLYSDDLCGTINTLKKDGVTVYGAYLRNGRPYNETEYRTPCAILIGNEGNGITDEAIARVSERVYIPMHGQIESLNAAVAAALIMYKTLDPAQKP